MKSIESCPNHCRLKNKSKCNMLCTSGFVDDAIISHNDHIQVRWHDASRSQWQEYAAPCCCYAAATPSASAADRPTVAAAVA